ncbi:interleukin-1 receptor-like 2 isoform X2 [Eublepharis macularius]|uniref:Interleukin-1 receptor-like 2 isoform X2 n=1 Tax=Eublepharis macularius TaxID=481883 RepID=A0AA97KTZ5_EUBMA|nr:interleukin-1 receptor-like 2 isoform X2 [Eublepharis macularius]
MGNVRHGAQPGVDLVAYGGYIGCLGLFSLERAKQFSLDILTHFPLLSVETCTVRDEEVYNAGLETVIVGQPVGIDCYLDKILHLNQTTYSLKWYRNGSEVPITNKTDSRIHQHDNMLWFLSAIFQDSGFYTCILRESARCYKSVVRVAVFNNSDGQCFHDELFYEQEIPIGSNAKIVCPALGNFKEDMNALSVHWYKECKQLDGQRYVFYGEDFIINNVNSNDSGKYQCKATYTYEGNKYNISRSIFVIAVGSNVFVECNVSTFRDNFISISWKVNKTLVDILYEGRIKEGYQKDFRTEGGELSVVSLNITELKRDDYGEQFVCYAGEVAAYITVQAPTRHYIGYLVGSLAALVFVIALLVLIYLLFKIDIILWYRKSCHPFLHKKVADGKIYDAYVLYPKTHNPDCFVLKVLPEVLEKKCGYTLFIWGRDELPGKALVSVIDETIKQSRRLIIILKSGSPSYKLLEEAPEQQIAVYNALVHDGMKVILIELDKIKDYSNMPESIQYIKQKHGAIQWKGDLTERQSYSPSTKFWKKVRYRMPPGHQIFSELPLVETSLNTCQTIGR